MLDVDHAHIGAAPRSGQVLATGPETPNVELAQNTGCRLSRHNTALPGGITDEADGYLAASEKRTDGQAVGF
jgi:hypothetical protein